MITQERCALQSWVLGISPLAITIGALSLFAALVNPESWGMATRVTIGMLAIASIGIGACANWLVGIRSLPLHSVPPEDTRERHSVLFVGGLALIGVAAYLTSTTIANGLATGDTAGVIFGPIVGITYGAIGIFAIRCARRDRRVAK